MFPTIEDEYGFGIIFEPTHTDEDEAFYCQEILSGNLDAQESDEGFWAELTYDPDLAYEQSLEVGSWHHGMGGFIDGCPCC